jgi:hypothetical protein
MSDIEWGDVLLIEYQMFKSPPAPPVIPASLSGGLSSFLCPKVGGRGGEPRTTRGQQGGTPRMTSVTCSEMCGMVGCCECGRVSSLT